jgi:hypothetical protein
MDLVYATAEQIGASLESALRSITGGNELHRVDRQFSEDFNNYEFPDMHYAIEQAVDEAKQRLAKEAQA